MNVLEGLPTEIARHRILNTSQAATFWGVSVPHWRRLYRNQRVPAPILVSTRKLGWRVGDLMDALATRISESTATTA